MLRRITAEQLAELRHPTIYDIRLREERDLMGWIPGSLHRPPPGLEALVHVEGPVVVACATGRRSLELIERLRSQKADVINLDGGLLAWQQRYPTCALPGTTIDDSPLSPEQFVRQIRSCFVVESVESGAIEEAGDDPLAPVEKLFLGLTSEITPHEVRERIDQLAREAWGQGHRLDFIVEHVTQFYALVDRLDIQHG